TTALLFLGGVHYLSPLYGLKGVTLAYCITYFCYWIMMIVVIISYFKGNFRNE
ncbi:O-antigen translocase, partial [Escherichia coli]